MTVNAYPVPDLLFEAANNNGSPLAGGLLYSYAAGTNNPIATYQDSQASTPNTNPVVLNFRGEAPVFLLPNTGYKLNLTDSLGNQIPGFPVDNVYNSVILTLYGGVDTGVANAYILNFTANFTSYVDGTILWWTPANTNTGASTISINGLGVINLVNQDGTALRAGQLTASIVSSILIQSGQALLLSGSSAGSVLAIDGSAGNPSITFLNAPGSGFYRNGTNIGVTVQSSAFGQIAFGAITGTLTGVSGTVTNTCFYRIMGPQCMLLVPQTMGTSTSTSFTMTTTDGAVRPLTGTQQWFSLPIMQDNAASILAQIGLVVPGAGDGTVFNFYKNGSATGWTGSSTKGIGSASVGDGNFVTFIYSLQ